MEISSTSKLISSFFANASRQIDSSSNRDPVSHEMALLVRKVFIGLWLLVSLCGLSTNVINLRTFFRIGLDDTVTISFFVLAICDLAICGFVLIETACHIADIINKDLNLKFRFSPHIVLMYAASLRIIVNQEATFLKLFLAVQRCICVTFPFRVKDLFTPFRTYVFIGVSFSATSTCSFLYISSHVVVGMFNPETNSTFLVISRLPGSEPVLDVVDFGLSVPVSIASQAVVMLCLAFMVVALKKAQRFREGNTTKFTSNCSRNETSDEPEKDLAQQNKTTSSSNSKETQALIQVALVSGIFVVTNSCYAGHGIATVVLSGFRLYGELHNVRVVFWMVMITGEVLNSAVNLLVYYKFNSRFRQNFVLNKK